MRKSILAAAMSISIAGIAAPWDARAAEPDYLAIAEQPYSGRGGIAHAAPFATAKAARLNPTSWLTAPKASS